MTQTGLQKLTLKGFRCFDSVEFDFNGQLILIQGLNGSGKTSLLEALHYVCYLRSFRTHLSRDLIRFGSESFFIKAMFNGQEIKIGCTKNKRHIQINQKRITSYQELRQHYRVVTVTEDDLGLVKGGPDKRRSFLDHAVLLGNPTFLPHFKKFKTILDNRNALLQQFCPNKEELEIWTKKLWEQTQIVQNHRKAFLFQLQTTCDLYLKDHWEGKYRIDLKYSYKKRTENQSWEQFFSYWKESLSGEEQRYKRTLFGAHLDDLLIFFQDKPARLYSSRGQQKLIVLLIKIAQVQHLKAEQENISFLLDDFIADFDAVVMKKLISACIELKTQLIFTSPTTNGPDSNFLKEQGASLLNISI